ncbi:uncharacterized protein A1O9_04682 [Exophiala aquamarina CBS 119918]|uniref:RNA polymerase II subunit B1 CTD phosphatase RPAP2 homolog n=1 Tax=Exophiala aquamarina CBS 119918 TaxID=1182545 RepID=A0A072PIB8_9EURO|nr:uncharacterized protein A1O9_04682 [Exophiala aquamarina CBS 119918]KEF59834.1 hypothetical protein A1O9_04682 [Exophiala aquamarina CBS 119918]
MTSTTSAPATTDREERIRNTALRHAQDIEGRKRLQSRIADLVVEAYDLPSRPDADPGRPLAADATLFKQCLAVFRPSDLDDLIYERNVDDRCGYSLCPRPNEKIVNAGQKVWNQKGGKDFRLLDRAELEKFCSSACRERTAFVRAQLRTEPAWLRQEALLGVDVKLLDEIQADGGGGGLVEPLNKLALSQGAGEEMAEKLEALALERGEPQNASNASDPLPIIEKESDQVPEAPSLGRIQDLVEGHRPRKVRFQNA